MKYKVSIPQIMLQGQQMYSNWDFYRHVWDLHFSAIWICNRFSFQHCSLYSSKAIFTCQYCSVYSKSRTLHQPSAPPGYVVRTEKSSLPQPQYKVSYTNQNAVLKSSVPDVPWILTRQELKASLVRCRLNLCILSRLRWLTPSQGPSSQLPQCSPQPRLQKHTKCHFFYSFIFTLGHVGHF